VTFELGDPVAVFMLARKEPVRGAFERRLEVVRRLSALMNRWSCGCPLSGRQVAASFPVGDHAKRSSATGRCVSDNGFVAQNPSKSRKTPLPVRKRSTSYVGRADSIKINRTTNLGQIG